MAKSQDDKDLIKALIVRNDAQVADNRAEMVRNDAQIARLEQEMCDAKALQYSTRQLACSVLNNGSRSS